MSLEQGQEKLWSLVQDSLTISMQAEIVEIREEMDKFRQEMESLSNKLAQYQFSQKKATTDSSHDSTNNSVNAHFANLASPTGEKKQVRDDL